MRISVPGDTQVSWQLYLCHIFIHKIYGNFTVCVCLLIGLFLFSAFVRPFTLTVVTDDTENVDVFVAAELSNRGFSLSYRQVPCN
jgi:hypothetical protein